MKKINDRLKKAFLGIEQGNLSISGGAKVANLSYRDFYEKMLEHKIKSNFDEKSIGVSGKRLFSLSKKIKN